MKPETIIKIFGVFAVATVCFFIAMAITLEVHSDTACKEAGYEEFRPTRNSMGYCIKDNKMYEVGIDCELFSHCDLLEIAR